MEVQSVTPVDAVSVLFFERDLNLAKMDVEMLVLTL